MKKLKRSTEQQTISDLNNTKSVSTYVLEEPVIHPHEMRILQMQSLVNSPTEDKQMNNLHGNPYHEKFSRTFVEKSQHTTISPKSQMTQYSQFTRDEQQHMQRYSRMHSDKLLVPQIRSEMCQSDQAIVPLSVENRSAVDSEEFKVKQLYN